MRSKRWITAAGLAAVLVLTTSACGGGDDDSASTTTEGGPTTRDNVDGTLVLGKLLPQSGDLAPNFGALNTPIDMAVDEINAAGGVNGKDVETATADDGTDPDVATSSLDTLLNTDNVDAIIGPSSSNTALGIIDKVKAAGVVQCSGSNTSAELTDVDSGGFYFRTAPPDRLQGPALAKVVANDGRRKVALLTRDDSYGAGFGEALEARLAAEGVDVAVNAAYDPRASDFDADVAKVEAAAPDSVVVIGFPEDGAEVVKEMISQGIGPRDLPVYTADGMKTSTFAKAVDPNDLAAVEGLGGTAPAAAPAAVEHPFYAEYAKTGEDTIFSAYYYDCTILVALAAQAAGSDDPAEIRDHMLDVASGGTACQSFAACKELLDQGEDIDYEGASGPVDLDENHEPTYGVYDVWAYNTAGEATNKEGVAQIRIED